MNDNRDLLRHTLATLAYRAARALENAPDTFAEFSGAGRSPLQIVAHMGDLFDWALSIAQGNQRWHNSELLAWPREKQRFFNALAAFDAYVASPAPIHAPIERLFQGPIADALTHVGQLAMLRRLAGSSIRGENFYIADIATGVVGPDQPASVRNF